jgi:sterol desaturase/sphingolipid hydroxylase (fatty acid hydroxylase superfamily)
LSVLWPLINLAVLFLTFGFLARIAPCNPGPRAFVSRDLADNVLYFLFDILLFGSLAELFIQLGAGVAFGPRATAVTSAILAGYGVASRLPVIVQALLVLVVLDFLQYWLHRLFHGRALWPFHAVHHSAEDLDWTATFRIHPVNFAIYNAGALALVRLIGFSPAAFLIIGPFNLVIGPLVHANLDWTFGPFRYVLASPVYHRWHHVKDPAIHNKNFAPTFPVWDLMFGTFYMPKGVLPEGYGVEGVPPHFVGQLLYPFREIAGRIGRSRKGRASQSAALRT